MDGVCVIVCYISKQCLVRSRRAKILKQHVADWIKYKGNLEQNHTFISWKAEAGGMWHWGQPELGTKTKFPSDEKQEERIKSAGQ